MLKLEETPAALVLRSMNVRYEDAQREVEWIVGSPGAVGILKAPLTPRAKGVLNRISEVAAARTREIGAVDILLGVLEGQGIAIKVLRRLGVDVGRARTTLRKLLDSEAQ